MGVFWYLPHYETIMSTRTRNSVRSKLRYNKNAQEVPEHLSSWDLGHDPEQRHEPQHFSEPTSDYIPMPIPDTLLDNVSPEYLDHTPLTFGKHYGKTPDQVSKIDPRWLVWAFNNVLNKPTCSELLANACERELLTKSR